MGKDGKWPQVGCNTESSGLWYDSLAHWPTAPRGLHDLLKNSLGLAYKQTEARCFWFGCFFFVLSSFTSLDFEFLEKCVCLALPTVLLIWMVLVYCQCGLTPCVTVVVLTWVCTHIAWTFHHYHNFSFCSFVLWPHSPHQNTTHRGERACTTEIWRRKDSACVWLALWTYKRMPVTFFFLSFFLLTFLFVSLRLSSSTEQSSSSQLMRRHKRRRRRQKVAKMDRVGTPCQCHI